MRPTNPSPATELPVLDVKQSAKGRQRRQHILDIAMKAFARGGYSGTSIASVAEEAGLTLPGLLHYFPSKIALLLAVVEERDLQSQRLASAPVKHWRELFDLMRKLNRTNATTPNLVQVFAILNCESLMENHPAQPYFERRAEALAKFIEKLLRTGVEAGELRDTIDPAGIANEFIAVMDGLQVLWLRNPRRADLAAGIDSYVDRLIESIEIKGRKRTRRKASPQSRKA